MGIIRLSGSEAFRYAAEVWVNKTEELEKVDGFTQITGRCLLSGETSCTATAAIFRAPRSYTAEDMIELHLPGSPALLDMILGRLLQAGARMAEAGEFTARAFFNGRIDLTEAEAVAEMIAADSDAQLRAAERLLEGKLHLVCSDITNDLSNTLALIETTIDFSEENVDFSTSNQIHGQITAIVNNLTELLKNSACWRDLHCLPRVVVAGPANAGKSSLLNRLTGIDRSIVSSIAGATRDRLYAPLKLPQGECMLIDTAGMGVVSDPLTQQSQKLSSRAIESCDLVIWVYDVNTSDNPQNYIPESLNCPQDVIIVANKSDLLANPDNYCCPDVGNRLDANSHNVKIMIASALTGYNYDLLIQTISNLLHLRQPATVGSQSLALSVRQKNLMEEALESLINAQLVLDNQLFEPELVALDLRNSLDLLGKISGEVISDDILGRIFKNFCIGK